jgi:hypothetical protein
VPGCGGANLVAAIPDTGRTVAETERWVLLLQFLGGDAFMTQLTTYGCKPVSTP